MLARRSERVVNLVQEEINIAILKSCWTWIFRLQPLIIELQCAVRKYLVRECLVA